MDKVITIFRNRRSVAMDRLYEGLVGFGIEADLIQTIYINESPEFFTFFGVHETPTILCFTEGDEIKRLIGKEIDTNTLINFLK